MNGTIFKTLAMTALLGLASCALTSKSDLIVPRYFSLDQDRARSSGLDSKRSLQEAHELRLGRVHAAKHLEERLVFRTSSHELGFYEQRRWSEEPKEFLRRALSEELFERRGLKRVVSGMAPTLEVELSSFEEIRGKRPRARLRMTYVLHDEKSVILERTITIDRDVPSTTDAARADDVVNAMADALHKAVLDVSDHVSAALPLANPARPSPDCPNQPRPEALDPD